MRPIFVWLLLTGGFAAYFAVSLHFNFSGNEAPANKASSPLKTLALLVPMIICAAVQFRAAKLAGATGLQLWLQAAAGGIGAPIVGVIVTLVVIFAVFGKTP